MTFKTSLCAGVALSVAMLAAGAASAQDTTAWKGAPQWTNDDVDFKARGPPAHRLRSSGREAGRPAGRLQDQQRPRPPGFPRRGGQLNSYIAYKAEGGAVNGGAWAWDDVVLEYKPNDMTSITARQYQGRWSG